MVSSVVPEQFQTITITGSGLGTLQAHNGNSSYIRITDLTSGWSAGNSESCGPLYGCPDPVSLAISSWTDSQIIIIGLTTGYGQNQHTLNVGDHTELYILESPIGRRACDLRKRCAGDPNPVDLIRRCRNRQRVRGFTSASAGNMDRDIRQQLGRGHPRLDRADFDGNNAPTSVDGSSVTTGGQPAFVDYISPTQRSTHSFRRTWP